jgi:hypothetical protein
MLVWVASFPRSGNTFLRIVLHRRYGLPTSVIYDHDGVAERVGGQLIGYTERPGPLAQMRAAAEPAAMSSRHPSETTASMRRVRSWAQGPTAGRRP